MAESQPAGHKGEHQLERLRDLEEENARLRKRVEALEQLVERERTVAFEFSASGAANGENDISVLLGDQEFAVAQIANQVVERVGKQDSPREKVRFTAVVEEGSDTERTWRGTAIRARENGRLLVAARELTDTEERVQHLEEKQALYHKLVDLLPEPVLFTNRLGHLLYVNPAGYALLGFSSEEELIGSSIWSFVHEDDLERVRARAKRLLTGYAVEEGRFRFVRRDGATVEVETHSVATRYEGRPAVLSTARDVTERTFAANAVRESRELLSKMFHASPAAIVLIRRDDGTVLDVNSAWSELTGYALEEAIGQSAEDLDCWCRLPDQELHAVGGSVPDAERPLRRKDGSVRTVLCSAQEIQVEGAPALLTVMNDITSRKQMELDLIKARDRAREMAAIKSSFLTNMTHEIRTPLTVILGFTTMLKQGVEPAYKRFVNVIERSGKRLLLTLDSILDLAQLEAGALEVDHTPFNISDAVEGAIETVKPLAQEKGLTIRYQQLQQPVQVAGGHRVFHRIIHHLLDNAVKFTESGDVIVDIEILDDELMVSVTDTGIGIEEEFLPRIFEEFSQESTGLERTHQGSGLGLAVSQRLALALGGKIHVSSAKGTGSTFRLVLPRLQAS